MLLLFSWSPVRELCLNYEVFMLQPLTGTPPDLGSIANCYVAIILKPLLLYFIATQFPPGGGYPLTPRPTLPFLPSCLHTGSFFHLGFICLRPRIPRPIALCIRLQLR